MGMKFGMLKFSDMKNPKIIFKISRIEDNNSYSNFSTVSTRPARPGHNHQINIIFTSGSPSQDTLTGFE